MGSLPDERQKDLRRKRQQAFEVTDESECPNEPDETGEWPCNPQVIFGGGFAQCSVCGREGKWESERLP